MDSCVLAVQGRLVAKSPAEAVVKLMQELKHYGCEPIGEAHPYPCAVQPWNENIWWEYQIKVRPIRRQSDEDLGS